MFLIGWALVAPAAMAAAAQEKPAGPAITVAEISRAEPVDFEHEVLPILRASCLACHNRTRAKADLILETPQGILKGGENGPAVIAGKSQESLLLKVASHREDPVMPPKDNKVLAADLTPQQLGVIRLWIDQGAKGVVRGDQAIQWQAPAKALQPVYAVALTADGRFAAAGRANRIDLYDLPGHRWTQSLADPKLTEPGAAHREMVESLAFSPDGMVLASGGFGEVKMWRRPPASVKYVLAGHGGAKIVSGGADGKWLAAVRSGEVISGGEDGTLRLWNAGDGRMVKQMNQGSAVTSLVVRPDGKFFAAAGKTGPAKLWDVAKGTMVAELKGDMAADAALAAAQRRQQIAAGDVAYFTAVLQRAEAERKAAADRLKNATTANAAAEKALAEKDAARIKAIADRDAAVKAFAAAQDNLKQRTTDLASAQKALKDTQNDPSASAVKVVTMQSLVAVRTQVLEAAKGSASQANFDAKKSAAELAIKAAEEQVAAAKLTMSNARTELNLATAADAKVADAMTSAKAAAGSADARQKQADTELVTAKATATALTEQPARDLAFSKDNLLLASVCGDGRVHLWTADDGTPLETLSDRGQSLDTVIFSGGSLLASDANETTAWSLGGSWSLWRTIGAADGPSHLADRVGALAFSPDGKLLATGSGEPTRSGEVKLWDVATDQLVRDFKDVHSDAVLALAFSPDGKLLASGATDRMAKILDVNKGNVIRSLEGHTGHVFGVAWKADGRTLATCSADRQVKFWDTTTGDRRANVGSFGKDVMSVGFIGTSDLLAAASGDGVVKLVNEAGNVSKTASAKTAFLQSGAVTPDGKLIAVGGEAGAVIIWRELEGAGQTLAAPGQR